MLHARRFFGRRLGGGERGHYWPQVAIGEDRPRWAVLYCPECGRPISLHQHTISPTGSVSPSVVCPNPHPLYCNTPQGPRCTFHDMVTLDGWDRIGADPFDPAPRREE